MNDVLIKLLKSKKPLNNGKFVDKAVAQLYLNDELLFTRSSDEYAETQQELLENFLLISSKIVSALEKKGVECSVRHIII